ncbi:MAG: hypothetical protein GX492_10280 [Firmicutes bacterium]|nr:hypothetical protein [Bacillota bacterium]
MARTARTEQTPQTRETAPASQLPRAARAPQAPQQPPGPRVPRTARTLADLWRISALVYREAMFQSFYVLKRGGQLPATKAPGEFRKFMNQSALVMKSLLCVFLGGTAVGAAFGAAKASFPGVTPAVSMAVVAGMFILAVAFIITVMAMDMVTGFVSAKAVQTLVLLPLSRQEVATTTLLGFLRIFDAPLVTGLAAFAISHVVLTRSVVGALAYLAGVGTAEAFAVVLALALAELFYAKVFNQTGSGFRSVARILYLIISIMPGVGMYLLFNYQASAAKAILAAIAANPGLAGVLQFIYPASFGFLIAAATGAQGATRGMLVASGLASVAYVGLAAWGLAWAASRLRARALGGAVGAGGGPRGRTVAKDFRVRPVAPWLGVLIKDMRLVFRSPSEAALLLMPAAAVVPWAVVMGSRGRLAVSAPGLVTFVGFMAVTAVPALFNVEAVGQAYVRTLPVKSRWTLSAKAAVATTTYIVSVIVLLVVAALAGRAETGALVPFGGFGVLPTAAGSLVTGCVLSARSRLSGGGGRVSPFMSSGSYLAALAAGGVAVAVPYIVARIGSTMFRFTHLPTYFTVGLLELMMVAAAVLSERPASQRSPGGKARRNQR